jgi:hypothetical protein
MHVTDFLHILVDINISNLSLVDLTSIHTKCAIMNKFKIQKLEFIWNTCIAVCLWLGHNLISQRLTLRVAHVIPLWSSCSQMHVRDFLRIVVDINISNLSLVDLTSIHTKCPLINKLKIRKLELKFSSANTENHASQVNRIIAPKTPHSIPDMYHPRCYLQWYIICVYYCMIHYLVTKKLLTRII